MNEEIRKIVEGYISEGDYEKALSLLMKFPLDDEQDKALLESCKKEFATSCASAIAEAAKAKNKDKAELILSSYKHLLGEDTNTILYQTIVDGIQEQKAEQPAPQAPVINAPQKPAKVKTFVESFVPAIKNFFKNPSDIFKNCAVGEDFIEKRGVRIAYFSILALSLLALLPYNPGLSLFILTLAITIYLVVPVWFSKNKRFKVVASVMLPIPLIMLYICLAGGVTQPVVWWTSIIFSAVYFLVTPANQGVWKIIVALLLWTILNPLMSFGHCYEESTEGWSHSYYFYFFNGVSIAMYILSLLVFFVSFIETGKLIAKMRAICNKALSLVVAHKKICIIVASTIVALIILNTVLTIIQNQREEEERRIAAIERARLDSIQAIENERIRAEEARKAAIEKARQDSIREVQRREQARRDSIAEIEHAAFVKKYARIGVIVEYMTMTRGTEDGEGTKGIKFRVFNPTKKTIKYVIISAYPVDRFGSRLYYTETCRGIGPVSSHDWASWSFDNVFPDRNDVIDDLKVSMQVVYTDGSSKSINVRNATVSSSSYEYSWFRD